MKVINPIEDDPLVGISRLLLWCVVVAAFSIIVL